MRPLRRFCGAWGAATLFLCKFHRQAARGNGVLPGACCDEKAPGMAKFQGFNAGNAGQVCLWRASPLGRKGHTQRLGAKALGHPLCTVAAALGRVHHKLCAAGMRYCFQGAKRFNSTMPPFAFASAPRTSASAV